MKIRNDRGIATRFRKGHRLAALALMAVGTVTVASCSSSKTTGSAAATSASTGGASTTSAPTSAAAGTSAATTSTPATSAAAGSSAATGSAPAGGKHYTIRYSTVLPATDPESKTADYFAQQLEKLSNGQITVQVYYSSQLGTVQDQVNNTKAGTIQMIGVDYSYISPFDPSVSAFLLPYLFTTKQQAYDMEAGPLGASLSQDVIDKAGLRGVGWLEFGWRDVANNKRPLTDPAAFNGLKIRVTPSSIGAQTASAFGATPVTMDISEVYTSLKQGVLNGVDTTLTTIVSSQFQNVAKYVTDLQYQYDMGAMFINNKFFESLPSDLQADVNTAAQAAQVFNRNAQNTAQAAAAAAVKTSGAQLITLTDAQKAVFKKASQPVYAKIAALSPQAKQWVDQLSAISGG